MTVTNTTRKAVLGIRVQHARRWYQRLRGLLGRDGLGEGEGLLLEPCRAVHMLGMRFALDVLFVDRNGMVVAVYPGLAPGARTPYHRAARAALELPTGTLAATGTVPGDRLTYVMEEHP
ncbi:MAG TPA: DUF192 domain-containing protein [Gemmatimonadales bacterium]|nr:DUF192 domain-containing protein [Gemmatimonadales bacterium]